MREFELTFKSVNRDGCPKPITALVIAPNKIDSQTGIMMFTHGMGGCRFGPRPLMEFTADEFNLICVSTEFRQSGYDFDPVGGAGICFPYDGSFYQVFDVLNALRETMKLYPEIDKERLFYYGGSQGAHIGLISSFFAPDTFAFVYGSCPPVRIDDNMIEWMGRQFTDWERSARNVLEHAEFIKCHLLLQHGTEDEVVPLCHTQEFAARLDELGKQYTVKYYEGGSHSLEPVSTALDAFKLMAPEPMRTMRNTRTDDFTAGNTVKVPCGTRTLVIDWSKPGESAELFRWE
jgi:predicted esterase